MAKGKHWSQTRSPAPSHSKRAKRATPDSPQKMIMCASSSPDEDASITFSFELGVACLMQCLPCSPGSLGGFRRLFSNVRRDRDYLGFIEACSSIRTSLVTSGAWGPHLFKGEKLRWVSGIRAAIESATDCRLIVHPSRSFDAVATFLAWLKRLPVCIRDSREAIDEYFQNDRALSSICFDDNVYVPMLEEIWFSWLRDFRIQDPFLPKHGSGSTADCGRVRSMKWKNLAIDAVARVCFRLPNLQSGVEHLPVKRVKRLAKVVFVPKQAGKDRTICMEPAWLQYLQQGVAGQLVSYIHSGSTQMKMYINIYSQDVNRRLCGFAYQQDLATLDLSNASDSVSWRLVRKLTRRIPLRRYLYGSRSTSTLLDGYKVQFDKFAPMGSALCFPIECILFASIVELAYRLHYGEPSYGHLSGCSVYGDDIICPSALYQRVVDILTSLGFTVNDKKSYSSGPYRESCGVEYLHGVMINTIKHPRSHLLCQETVSPESIGLITDLSNTLLRSGCFQARRMLLSKWKEAHVRIGSKVVPFLSLVRFDEDHCIPILPSYAHTKWDREIQRPYALIGLCESSTSRAFADYVEFQSMNVRADRRTRVARVRGGFDLRLADEKWSRKAVTYLAKFGHIDLLIDGDLEEVGSHRTGRLHYRYRRSRLYL